MAWELPAPPWPTDVNGVPYITSPDTAGKHTVPASTWFKDESSGLWVPVSASKPLPIKEIASSKTMRVPVTGVKTVTATAAEIFAGTSRLVGRRKMVLKNEDPILRFRIGPSGVTQQNGFPIEPLAVLELDFDPSVDVPVYAISEGASLQVAVMEI